MLLRANFWVRGRVHIHCKLLASLGNAQGLNLFARSVIETIYSQSNFEYAANEDQGLDMARSASLASFHYVNR